MSEYNFKLQPYQREAVEYGKKNPYCIYALQMGLGKSLISLVTAVETKSKALIVVPSYLVFNWVEEINKFFPEKTYSLLKTSRDFYYPWDSDFVIITYSFLKDADLLFEWADMVIFDESQYMKEMSSIRSEAAHRLVYENSVKRLLLLTGTPILNRVYEFYSLITLTYYDPRFKERPEFLERFPTYVEFATTFSNLLEYDVRVPTKNGMRNVTIKKWEGYKNEEELKKYLKNRYIRFKSEDVLDLPNYSEISVYANNIDDSELLEEFEKFTEENKSVLPKIKAKAALATAPFTVKFVEDLLEKDLQVIVYSDHVDSAEFIAKKLGVEHIDGSVKVEKRHEIASRFKSGELKVLVATIKSFSTGVNLQNAYTMVFNDLSWTPGEMAQAKYRIIREGQKNKCFFYYILGSRQSSTIMETIKRKMESIEAVT